MNTNNSLKSEFENCKQDLMSQLGQPAYQSWLQDLALESLEKSQLNLIAPTKFKANQVMQRYATDIQSVWNRRMKMAVDSVSIKCLSDMSSAERLSLASHNAAASVPTMQQQLGLKGIQKNKHAVAPALTLVKTTPDTSLEPGHGAASITEPAKEDYLSQLDTPLDSRLKFDRFLVGEGNRLAYAAALNVVENMTTDDRLVYFHGASGRGKTHLLNAIGHALHEKKPQARIFYLTYDNLLNSYVTAVMSRNVMELRQFMHQIDILLVDDLHLLRGRKATQEELLNLINRLTHCGKTVVVAGGMAPQRLAETGINQRLTDRLAGGTSIPIEKPDLRLRLAIVQDMALRNECEGGVVLPEAILELIARRAEISVRELEGAFRFIRLQAQADKKVPSEDEVKTMLNEHFRHHRRELSLDEIKASVAEKFGWSVQELEGRKRPQPLVKARHAFCLVARKLTNESLTTIGHALNRDHTTVISSLDRAEVLAETDSNFADKITALLEEFEQ